MDQEQIGNGRTVLNKHERRINRLSMLEHNATVYKKIGEKDHKC